MSSKNHMSDKLSSNNDNEIDETESEDHFCPKENAGEYKGIFYNDDNEHKFFEYGAHFQYNDLCSRLDYLNQLISTETNKDLDTPSESTSNKST